MARLFTSGFEENTNTAGVEWTSTSGSPSIVSSGQRSGNYAGQVASLVSGTAKEWVYQFSSANISTDSYFRVYFKIVSQLTSGTSVIAGVFDSTGNNAGFIQIDSSGNIGIHDNSGFQVGSSTALSTGQWYRLEVRYFNTSSIMELKVDGVVIATETGGVTDVIRELHIGGNIGASAGVGGSFLFDDVAINDTSGTAQNSYPGEGQVTVLRPNAAGDNNAFTVQVGGTAGAANNFTRVSEVTPDDATTYNGDVLSGNIDDFNIDNTSGSIASGDTITLVQANIRYRAVVAAAEAVFKTRIKKTTGGTVSSSAAITPTSTTWVTNANAVPRLPPQTLYVDPDGAAWTKATLDTAQLGYTISTTNTNAADISAIWLTVESVAATVATSSTYYPVRIANRNVGPMALRQRFRQPYYPVYLDSPAVSASITQVAATVTATGGTQTIATVRNVAVTQVAATVTASGGTQVVSAGAVVNATVTQVAATVTATGGTQVVTASQKVAIAQVAASVTATGGTQTVATVNNVSIAQVAGSVTVAGGTQVVATSRLATIAQVAATVTATGGTQTVQTVSSVAITQVAANVTASGGTQVLSASRYVSVAQIAGTVTATGGTQAITATSSVSIAQVAGTVTVTGGAQTVTIVGVMEATTTKLIVLKVSAPTVRLRASAPSLVLRPPMPAIRLKVSSPDLTLKLAEPIITLKTSSPSITLRAF